MGQHRAWTAGREKAARCDADERYTNVTPCSTPGHTPGTQALLELCFFVGGCWLLVVVGGVVLMGDQVLASFK